MSCNCDKDNNTKQLEILAKGSYADRLLKTIYICFVVFAITTILSLSITLIYITSKVSDFLNKNELVLTETINTNSHKIGKTFNSNISINTNSDNNTIGDK